MRKNSESGVGMVGALVTAAILGGLGLVATKVLDIGTSGVKGINQKMDFVMLQGEIQTVLTKKQFCKTALRDAGGAILTLARTPPFDVVAVVRDTGAGVIEVARNGQKIHGIQIDSMNLNYQMNNATPPAPVPPIADTPVVGKTTHYLNLVINARRIGGGSGGTEIHNRAYPLKVTLITDSATSAVEDCDVATVSGQRGEIVPCSTAQTLSEIGMDTPCGSAQKNSTSRINWADDEIWVPLFCQRSPTHHAILSDHLDWNANRWRSSYNDDWTGPTGCDPMYVQRVK